MVRQVDGDDDVRVWSNPFQVVQFSTGVCGITRTFICNSDLVNMSDSSLTLVRVWVIIITDTPFSVLERHSANATLLRMFENIRVDSLKFVIFFGVLRVFW